MLVIFVISIIWVLSTGCYGRSVVEEHQLHHQDQAIRKQHVVSGDKRLLHKQHPLSGDKRLLHYPNVELDFSLILTPGGPNPIHHER